MLAALDGTDRFGQTTLPRLQVLEQRVYRGARAEVAVVTGWDVGQPGLCGEQSLIVALPPPAVSGCAVAIAYSGRYFPSIVYLFYVIVRALGVRPQCTCCSARESDGRCFEVAAAVGVLSVSAGMISTLVEWEGTVCVVRFGAQAMPRRYSEEGRCRCLHGAVSRF